MRVAIDFKESPSAAEWATLLADDGWKLTSASADGFRAERVIGNVSEYPERQRIRWYVRVEEAATGPGVTVSVAVPVFAESPFARQRLLETVETYADEVDGECHTEAEFDIALLDWLRDRTRTAETGPPGD
jgi:hypothetical protein